MEPISINEAARRGIDKLKQPQWANLEDYLKIDIIDGMAGPWGHFYSPLNKMTNGKNPIDILLFELLPKGRDDACFIPAETAI